VWVDEFRSALGDWRAFRDDFRQRWFTWGIEDNAQIDGWRRELARFRADVTAAGQTTATPAEPAPSALEELARRATTGAGNVATSIATPIGIGLGVLVVLWGFSQIRR